MTTIGDILHPRRVDLRLAGSAQEQAIFQVASLLKGDERVSDWTEFYSGLIQKRPCTAAGDEFEICIPHTRTSAVATMVMAAGRSNGGVLFPDSNQKIHYIFVIGVPLALAADYLRIIGALARIFRNKQAEQSLRQASNVESFLTILTDYEMKF